MLHQPGDLHCDGRETSKEPPEEGARRGGIGETCPPRAEQHTQGPGDREGDKLWREDTGGSAADASKKGCGTAWGGETAPAEGHRSDEQGPRERLGAHDWAELGG